MKLRLLLWTMCDRDCEGCCNKDWDLDNLKTERDFNKYSLIMLTGGEPMINPSYVHKIIWRIKKQTNAPIVMYTADVTNIVEAWGLLYELHGMTITLHEQEDVVPFLRFNAYLSKLMKQKSLRLNVFKNINLSGVDTDGWEVKDNIEWIKNCPLPEGEVLKTY